MYWNQFLTSDFDYLPTTRTFSRLFALVVGINEYDPPLPHLRPLRGAVADAQAIKQWLEFKGVPSENITLLANKSATCSAIIAALTWLKNNSQIRPGDPIFIFFAGHGAQVNAPNGWECGGADRMIQVIVPHDCELVKLGKPVGPISDRVLGALIANIAERKGNNIVSHDSRQCFSRIDLKQDTDYSQFVVLDCCYSASGTRGAYPSDVDDEVTPRAVELVNDYSASLEQQLRDTGSYNYRLRTMPGINFSNNSLGSHVLLAACSRTEQASEHREGGLMRGRFTSALLRFLYAAMLSNIQYSDILGQMEKISN